MYRNVKSIVTSCFFCSVALLPTVLPAAMWNNQPQNYRSDSQTNTQENPYGLEREETGGAGHNWTASQYQTTHTSKANPYAAYQHDTANTQDDNQNWTSNPAPSHLETQGQTAATHHQNWENAAQQYNQKLQGQNQFLTEDDSTNLSWGHNAGATYRRDPRSTTYTYGSTYGSNFGGMNRPRYATPYTYGTYSSYQNPYSSNRQYWGTRSSNYYSYPYSGYPAYSNYSYTSPNYYTEGFDGSYGSYPYSQSYPDESDFGAGVYYNVR